MTRFEQIAVAFPLHAQRIAECTAPGKVERWRNAPASDGLPAGDILRGAFHWAGTTEGHEYWSALAAGARL